MKDRKQRFELDAARIVAEMRIGELLGEPEAGRPKGSTGATFSVPKDDRVRFRKLAEHRPLVLRLLY